MDIQLEKEIQKKIDILNEIFREIKVPFIFENQDFLIDEYSTKHYLKFKLNHFARSNIPMKIHLAEDGIQLDIYGISEAFEWGNKDLAKFPQKITTFFKEIFTSYILLENCGWHNNISLFNKKGEFVAKYNLTTSLSGYFQGILKHDCNLTLFLPIY
jgi:hypothetical protein